MDIDLMLGANKMMLKTIVLHKINLHLIVRDQFIKCVMDYMIKMPTYQKLRLYFIINL